MARRTPQSAVKRAREQALREKREIKQAKKEARAAERRPLGFEESIARITELASGQGGTITAADIEADEVLARDREMTAAAAHQLAGVANVIAVKAAESTEWFPYDELAFVDEADEPEE
jgi:hypothetical protein